MKRRILPMIMAVIMILSIIQVPAWAADESSPMETADNTGLTSEQPMEKNEDPGASVEEEEPASSELPSLPDGETEEESAPEEQADNYVAEVNGQGFPTLQAAIDAAGEEDTITLLDNIKLDPNYAVTEEPESDDEGKLVPLMKITKDITLDLSEYSIGWDLEKLGDADSIWYTLCFMDVDSATVRFTGNGTIDTEANDCNSYGINITNGGAAIVEGGTYTGATTAFQVTDGTLTINSGTFKQAKTIASAAPDYAKYVINCIDVAYKNGEAGIEVNGGTFIGFNPADNPEGEGTSYVASSSLANEEQGGTTTIRPYTAEDDVAAQIDERYYPTLQAAINNAGKDITVTLLKNTNEDIVIPKDAELTLDLNGRTLTNVSGHTITNNGTLTITGDGTVDNVTHGKAAIQNEPGGMVVLNGGAYTRSEENGNDDADSGGNSYYNIVNHGTMEINDGVSVTQTGHFSSMIENGWYRGSENTGGQNSVLTINGGTFSGGLNTIKNDDYGELTINDGTFENMSQATFLNWNIATVNGGTFNAESASSGAILNGYINDSMDQGELTINGGTFNAGDSKTVITTMGGAKHSGDIEITGGTLSGSIVLTDSQDGAQMTITQDAKVSGNVTNSGKADVAITDGATVSGQVSNGTDGTMSVVNSTVGSVPEGTTAETIVIVNSTVDGELTTNTGDKAIMVGGKTYDTMAKAIEAVGNGQTIYVLKDIPDAVGIAVPSSKNFTIDFGGHTYTLIGPGAGSSGTETNGFQLLKDSTITLKNGTIRIAEGANNIKRIIQNYANLTLEDMHIYAQNQQPDENYALSFNNGDITFKGDTDVITTSDETIAFDVCKFASYPSANVAFDESYTGTINGKIVYDSTDANTHTLTIQGNGTFGTIEAASGAGEAAKAGIEVTSGHFAEPVNEDYLADSVKAQLESASNPEAPYSYYPSVENAIAAAKPGDTVTAVNTKPGKTTYTVTLKFNDGKTDNLTYEVSEGTAIDLPTPSRSGYTFEGWYDGNTRVSDPYNVTKTVTLTAGWDYKDDDHGSSSSGSSSSVRRYNIEADAGRGGDISPDGRVRVRRGENQTFRITADDGYEIYDVEVDGESVGATPSPPPSARPALRRRRPSCPSWTWRRAHGTTTRWRTAMRTASWTAPAPSASRPACC